MSVNELRTLVNDYYNNNRISLEYFHERNDYSTNLNLHIRGLQIDLNIENDIFRVQTILINRAQQIDAEIRNFNNIYINNPIINVDPDNHWPVLYNSTINLLRIIHVFMGLILIDYAQINIDNQVIDDIMNQLNVNDIINNHQQFNNIDNILYHLNF